MRSVWSDAIGCNSVLIDNFHALSQLKVQISIFIMF